MPDAVLVGGAVRDVLMNREPHDIDIVTRQPVRPIAEALAAHLDGHAFALDVVRDQYRVSIDGAGDMSTVDIGRIDDLPADLARRDFTINAMAALVLADGSLGELIDRFEGRNDIERGLVRMVSPENLAEDPLRLLRAVRLAIELDLGVEPATAETVRRLAPRLAGTPGERQRDELARIFSSPRALEGIRLADALGLLDVFLPELAPARGVEQPVNHHYYDVFEHSLQALGALDEMLHDRPTQTNREWLGPDFRELLTTYGIDIDAYLDEVVGSLSRRTLLKLAGLLHDVSKPETRALHDDGRVRFLGHPEQGAIKAEAICARLRFSNREARFVSLLVEEHLRPTQLAPQGAAPSRRALYRFARDLGDALPACLILSLADAAAATGPRLQQERWRRHVTYICYVLQQVEQVLQPAQNGAQRLLTGRDLMSELGMEPGPALGRVLAALEEAQALGEIATRDEALAYARNVKEASPQ